MPTTSTSSSRPSDERGARPRRRAGDDVRGGEHEAVRRDHDAAAAAVDRAAAPNAPRDAQVRDRRREPLGDGDDGPRVGVERLLVGHARPERRSSREDRRCPCGSCEIASSGSDMRGLRDGRGRDSPRRRRPDDHAQPARGPQRLQPAMHAALAAALKEARGPEVRAVVLTGAGRGFCVGQDLSEFRRRPATSASGCAHLPPERARHPRAREAGDRRGERRGRGRRALASPARATCGSRRTRRRSSRPSSTSASSRTRAARTSSHRLLGHGARLRVAALETQPDGGRRRTPGASSPRWSRTTGLPRVPPRSRPSRGAADPRRRDDEAPARRARRTRRSRSSSSSRPSSRRRRPRPTTSAKA